MPNLNNVNKTECFSYICFQLHLCTGQQKKSLLFFQGLVEVIRNGKFTFQNTLSLMMRLLTSTYCSSFAIMFVYIFSDTLIFKSLNQDMDKYTLCQQHYLQKPTSLSINSIGDIKPVDIFESYLAGVDRVIWGLTNILLVYSLCFWNVCERYFQGWCDSTLYEKYLFSYQEHLSPVLQRFNIFLLSHSKGFSPVFGLMIMQTAHLMSVHFKSNHLILLPIIYILYLLIYSQTSLDLLQFWQNLYY